MQSRLLWYFGCENRFLFFFCFEVLFFCWLICALHILLSCLFFLPLNQVCRFNKKCCRVIHSLQKTDEITPIDPTRTSGISCFLNPFILLPPQFLSHFLVFILFKHSALRKNGARQAFSSNVLCSRANFYICGNLNTNFNE